MEPPPEKESLTGPGIGAHGRQSQNHTLGLGLKITLILGGPHKSTLPPSGGGLHIDQLGVPLWLAGWRTCQSPGWRVTGRRRRTGSSLKEADVPCTDIQHEAPNETGHTTIKLKLRQKLYLELPNFLSTTKVNQYFQLVGVSKVFNVNPYQSPIYLEDKHTSFSVPR